MSALPSPAETDTKFGGVSVFTKDSTLVIGLKNKKRYPGFDAKTSFPSFKWNTTPGSVFYSSQN